MIKTRFAPSPTGFLHIGGVRTALFNYLYAKNQSGQFLLRMEDTDRERSQDIYEKEIIDSLKWLGLDWDGTLIRQSERVAHYRELAEQLVQKDLAYHEEKDGKTAVKFKMPQKSVLLRDLIRGDVVSDTSLFDDLVIIKSDGFPTYHFSCVVDDHESEITHVIRGEDHLSNTPRQMLLYEAFGWKAPKYAHLPLILGGDGAPLSKRHGHASLEKYRTEGYLPFAILNYLTLLGWGAGDNQEFFSPDELIKKFSLKKVTKAGARFDPEKLLWMNAQYIKRMETKDYLDQVSAYYGEHSKRFDTVKWQKLALLYKSRIQTFTDLQIQANCFFDEHVLYEPESLQAFLSDDAVCDALKEWRESANELENFDSEEALEKLTRDLADKKALKAAQLIHPLRFAITGVKVSPGLFELMSALGKDICLKRLGIFLSEKNPQKEELT